MQTGFDPAFVTAMENWHILRNKPRRVPEMCMLFCGIMARCFPDNYEYHLFRYEDSNYLPADVYRQAHYQWTCHGKPRGWKDEGVKSLDGWQGYHVTYDPNEQVC